MAWRNSALWMTGGMVASVGFVWAGHLLKNRPWARGKRQEGSEARDNASDDEGERMSAREPESEFDDKLERRARLEATADEIAREEQLARESTRFGRAGVVAAGVADVMPIGAPPIGSERPFSSGEPAAYAKDAEAPDGWRSVLETAPPEEPLGPAAVPGQATAKGLFSLPVGELPPIVQEAADLDVEAQEDAARDDAMHDIFSANEPRMQDVAGVMGSDPAIEVGDRESLDIDIDLDDLDAERTSGIDSTIELDDLDIVEDTRRDPTSIEWPESGETVRSKAHYSPIEEPYDAMDAEDVGAEWLTRATESMPIEGRDPVDALEGTNVIDLGADDPSLVPERNYGANQAGEPLSRYAGTSEEDVAATLPVGNVDDNGNVELHEPVSPPDALDAPPTSELSPTLEDLAHRQAASKAARRRKR
jgi:hypothetical protein